MITLRDANITLRWLMLHKSCKNKLLKQIIDDPTNKTAREKDIVKLILYLSKYEHIMKDIFTNLVTQKTQIWADDKAKCVENMNEIAEYFSGNRNWGKANIDENYAGWFRNLTTMIDGLDFKHSTKTGRKIQQISQGLEDIQVYEEIEKSVQIKHYINETQKLMGHMIRITSVKRN